MNWYEFTTNHRFVGATVRASNRTFGLRPAQEVGPEETVTSVCEFDSTVQTDQGNVYSNGDYTLMRLAG